MPKYYAEYMDELERQRRLQEEQRIREESDRKLAQVAALEERARNAQLQREWANHQKKYNQMANSSAAKAAGDMVANAPSAIDQRIMQNAFPYLAKQQPDLLDTFQQASQIDPNTSSADRYMRMRGISAEPEIAQVRPYTSALDQAALIRDQLIPKKEEPKTPKQSALQGVNVPDGGIQQPNYALKNVPKQSTLTNVSVPDNGNRSADLVRNLENAERAEDKRAVLGNYLDSLPNNAKKYLQQYEEGYLMSTSGGHGSTGSMRRAQAQGGQMMQQARENLKKELNLTDDQVTDLLQYQQYRSNYDQNEKQQAEIYNALHTGNKAKQALAAATMTAQSIMQSPVAGISAVAANTSRKAPGLGTDTYSPYFGSSNYAANVQQGVQNRIAESGTPAGQLGAKAYGIGYSIGESAYNMAGSAALGLPGLGTAGKVASLLPMGVNAYASQLREGLEKGLTEEQAQTTAVISGMAEVATELLSLDHFWDIAKGSSKTARKAVIDWIAQAGIEGTEELSSDVINHVADMLLNGDKAEYRVKVQDNIDAGMTEDQAKAKATKDTLLGWVESFIGGTISGGTMGGIATAINSYNTGKQAAEMFGENTNFREYEESIDTDEAHYQNKSAAESAKEAKQLAGVLANKQENGEQISKKDIKKLYTSMMDAVQTESATQQENARKQEEKAQLPKEDTTPDTTTETTAPTTETAAPTTKQEAPTTKPEAKVTSDEQNNVTNEQNNPENEQRVTENEQNNVTSDIPEQYSAKYVNDTELAEQLQNAKNPQELVEAYQNAVDTRQGNEHELTMAKGYYDAYALKMAKAKTNNYTLEDIAKAAETTLSTQRAYEAGLNEQQIDKSVLSSAAQQAYNDGLQSALVARERNESVQQNRMKQLANGYMTDISRRAFIERYIPGMNADIYKKSFDMAYDAGRQVDTYTIPGADAKQAIEKSWDDFAKKNSIIFAQLSVDQAKGIFSEGMTTAMRDRQAAIARSNMEKLTAVKGNGTFTDLRANPTNDASTRVIAGAARLFGLNIELRDTIEGGSNGYYDAKRGTIVLNASSGKTLVTLAHELGEFTDAFNTEEFQPLVQSGMQTLNEILGENKYQEMRREYENAYVAEFLNEKRKKTDADLDKEIFCDNIFTILGSEEGMNNLISKINQNCTVQQAKTIKEKLSEMIGKVIDAFKSIISSGKLNKWQQAAAEDSAKRMQDLQDRLTSAMANAVKNYQNLSEVAADIPVQKRFNLETNVEQTKDLIAVHNLDARKLLAMSNLEGIPMPSIAVTKADIGHSNFGDISLVFTKDTIDPKNKKNKVYGADAWTPTFPRVEYEADYKVANQIQDRVNGLIDNIPESYRNSLRGAFSGLAYNLDNYGGYEGIVDRFTNDYGLKAAYLAEKGNPVKELKTEKRYEMTSAEAGISQAIINEFGDDFRKLKGSEILEQTDRLRKALEEYYSKELGPEEGAKIADFYDKRELRKAILTARNFSHHGAVRIEETTDFEGMQKEINSRVNQDEYESWVRALFKGIEADSGLSNGKDPFTPSGNRRSFKSTHLPVNAENIVRAMLAQSEDVRNVSGFNGSKSIRAVATEDFKSIKDIKNAAQKLQTIDTEEYDQLLSDIDSRLSSVISEIAAAKGREGDFMAHDDIGELILDAARKKNITVQSVQKAFGPYLWDVTEDQAKQIVDIINDVKSMPVNMFEAKPQRVVGFNEIASAVIPDNASAEVKSFLNERGIPYSEYAADNEDSRKDIINSLENVRFSRDVVSEEAKRAAENIATSKITSSANGAVEIGRKNKIIREMLDNGSTSLIGKNVKNTDDLAALAQVYRDPRFETMRYFFTDNDKRIVLQTAVTSRMPGASSIIPEGKEVPEYIDTLARLAKDKGATGYYLEHNHPSGNVTPSGADWSITKYVSDIFKEKGITEKGHIILDHTQYAALKSSDIVVNSDNTFSAAPEFRNVPAYAVRNIVKPGEKDPAGLVGTYIRSGDDLATYGRYIRKNHSVLVLANVKMETGIIQSIPNKMLNSIKEFSEYIHDIAVDNGMANAFIVTDSITSYYDTLDLVEDGVLIDSLFTESGETGRSERIPREQKGTTFMGKYHVSEEDIRYSRDVDPNASAEVTREDIRKSIEVLDSDKDDVVTIPSLKGDASIFFTGTDEEIAAYEAQENAAKDQWKAIIDAPDFAAFQVDLSRGRTKILSPSIRGGLYQLSNLWNGEPVSHQLFGEEEGSEGENYWHPMKDLYSELVDLNRHHDVEVKVLKRKTADSLNDLRKSMDAPEVDFTEMVSSKNDDAADSGIGNVLAEGSRILKGQQVDQQMVRKIARKLTRKYGSKADINQFADDISRVFAYAQSHDIASADSEELARIMTEVAMPVIKEAQGESNEELKKQIRKNVSGLKLDLSEQQHKEVVYKYHSYQNYKQAMRKHGIEISANGASMDGSWGEIVDKMMGTLTYAENEGNEPIMLLDALNSLDQKIVQNGYGMNNPEAAKDLAMDVIAAYYEEMGKQQTSRKGVKDKDLADLKKQVAEARKIADDYKQQIKKEYQERYDEALKDLKQARQLASEETMLQVAALRAQNRHDIQRRIDAQEKAKQKSEIQKGSRQLLNMLANPTNAKHVPISLEAPVLDLLSSIDFVGPKIDKLSGGRYQTKVLVTTEEQGQLRRRFETYVGDTYQDVMRQYQEAMQSGAGSKAQRTWQQKLSTVKDLYSRAGTEGDSNSATDLLEMLDKSLLPDLQKILDDNDGLKTISSLSADELKTINKAIKNITTAINKIDKFYTSPESVSKLGNDIMEHAKKVMDTNVRSRARESLKDFFTLDNATPETYFHGLGKSGEKVFRMLTRANNVKARDIRIAQEYMADLLKDVSQKDIDSMTGEKAKIIYEEGSMKLDVGDVMYLYMLLKRQDAESHKYGGFEMDDKEIKGKVYRDTKPHFLDEKKLRDITDKLTPKQKEIAEKMQQFLAVNCSEWGNETAILLYGYEKFTDPNYIPMTVDKKTVRTNAQNSAEGMINSIRESGFTKNVIPNANNPLIIRNIFDVFSEHVTNMAAYHAYAAPLTDLIRWNNYKTTEEIEEGDAKYGRQHTVKEAIDDIYGKGGQSYLVQLVRDINQMEKQTKVGTARFAALMSHYKAAATLANLRVVAQQPTAWFRAGEMIDAKYLAAGLAPNKAADKMQAETSDISWIKAQGNIDGYITHSMKQTITRASSTREKINDAAGWLASKADDVTWNKLYRAVYAEQAAKFDGDLTSEEFAKKVNDRFDEVIARTQVVDGTLMRSQLMRSNDRKNIAVAAFMAEPTKSYNMFLRDYIDITQGKREGKKIRPEDLKHLTRTAAVYLVTNVANAVMQSIFDAERDDDEDKSYIEKLLNAFGINADSEATFSDKALTFLEGNLADDLNMFHNIPIVKDIYDYVWQAVKKKVWNESTYSSGTSDMDIASIAELKKAFEYTFAKSENSKITLYGTVAQDVKALSQFTGIPAYNLMRECVALYNTLNDAWGGENIRRTAKSKTELAASVVKDIKTGTDYAANLDKALDQGVSYDTIYDQIKDEYKQQYIGLMEAGNTKEAQALEEKVEGIFADLKKQEGKEYKPRVKGWYTDYLKDNDRDPVEAVFKSLDTGSDYKKAIENAVSLGKTYDSIESSVTKQYKQQYIDLMRQGKRSEAMKLENRLVTIYNYLNDKEGQKPTNNARIQKWYTDWQKENGVEQIELTGGSETSGSRMIDMTNVESIDVPISDEPANIWGPAFTTRKPRGTSSWTSNSSDWEKTHHINAAKMIQESFQHGYDAVHYQGGDFARNAQWHLEQINKPHYARKKTYGSGGGNAVAWKSPD